MGMQTSQLTEDSFKTASNKPGENYAALPETAFEFAVHKNLISCDNHVRGN